MPINEEKRFFSWLQVLDNPISVTEFFILLNLSYICWKAKVISEGLNFFYSHGSRGLRRNFVWGIMWNGNSLYVCMRDTRVAINRTHNFVKYLAPTYNSTGWSSKKIFISDHTILKWKQSTFFMAFLALYIRSPYFRDSLVTMKVWGFLALRTVCNPHGAPAARTSVQCMLSWSLHSRVFLPLKLSYANMFLRQINLLAIHA